MEKTAKTCERCGKKHLGTFVWLELNNRNGHYYTPGTVPAGDSQGLFAFGKTCAHRALGWERLEANPEAMALYHAQLHKRG